MYCVEAVANWFIQKALDEKRPIDQSKLMNIVYLAQGIGLALDYPVFFDAIEARQYGPVIPELYQHIHWYGLEPITELIQRISFDINQQTPVINKHDAKAKEILNITWAIAGDTTTTQISNWSHQKHNHPWYREWYHKGGKNRSYNIMSHNDIANYFKALLRVKTVESTD